MTEAILRELLESVRVGSTTLDDAVARLTHLPFEALPFARVDHHRAIRCGFPEVIFCPGKTPEDAAGIFEARARAGGNVLATRATSEQADAIRRRTPGAEHHERARAVTLHQEPAAPPLGTVAILAAGTSDAPVVEEAKVSCDMMNLAAHTVYDVGVAGLHRLVAAWTELRDADVLIVVAGMEGALPSVVGGLTDKPVIAVPTSAGYGASFGGLTALLAMLNTCASGVTVVNIDNGFGAACAAGRMLRALRRRGDAAP
ncbi:MAG: Pyridinium-3,5-biscarboxylic acid mononucleotide synthase [Phycisphaerae bacterium]|nr:Pyridinium-3,5-biscarboxylic acid mononucleotide synthase [Phycisphaerae bacterium]